MCGIVAAVGNIDPEICRKMLARIAHRGPDDTGELGISNIWLGHQRLSIMDVEGGRQPLADQAESAFVVANGEIYNHTELRAQLSDVEFGTGSDTEAALHLLRLHGPAALPRLRGMFALAFALPDGGFLAARDRLGVKPLYWARRPDGVLFASELRAFEPADRPAVRSFPPGMYWTPETGLVRFADAVPASLREPPARPIPWQRVTRQVRETLVASVEQRMMSEAGIGVFLSGGLDSAIIAAIAARWMRANGRKLPTFAVGSAGSSDLVAARLIAEWLGTEHHEIELTEANVLEALPEAVRVIEHYDPSLVRSSVPNLLLARYTVGHVHAVLTGEGADELFAGYSYLHEPPFTEPTALHAELVRSVSELHHLNLQRCDRTTMAFGLEARVPFLDRAVVETALSIAPEDKLVRPGAREKQLLREAFAGWLPEEILWRPKEQFGDGSGAADVLNAAAKELLTRIHEPIASSPDVRLRDESESLYYSLWRKELAGIQVADTLGMFATT
ncbi:asparagine synthase (glutamine-hydrolysing) [Tamaricihabitans halophyticus]|uniref:asparagine synthase (glutamine-hydrolyzing) n=1 Tax=Tamaricihabitans halophyticus TaxID=1262583 RepID=A0A4R2QLE1_9PSEU|nr:asparagine synthase (glutamine-hydrolyzing) [Tamaricihabitans halophyticus]TCP49348.1 asparagine synthase (glutamine-hydrolysing) [Tamaricihabitans halophyticus]